jgi:hypothetical protein
MDLRFSVVIQVVDHCVWHRLYKNNIAYKRKCDWTVLMGQWNWIVKAKTVFKDHEVKTSLYDWSQRNRALTTNARILDSFKWRQWRNLGTSEFANNRSSSQHTSTLGWEGTSVLDKKFCYLCYLYRNRKSTTNLVPRNNKHQKSYFQPLLFSLQIILHHLFSLIDPPDAQ